MRENLKKSYGSVKSKSKFPLSVHIVKLIFVVSLSILKNSKILNFFEGSSLTHIFYSIGSNVKGDFQDGRYFEIFLKLFFCEF